MSAEQIQTWLTPDQLGKDSNQEPKWLIVQRKEALDHYQKVGLPGVRDEQWRYTNLRTMKNTPFALSSSTTSSNETVLADKLTQQLGETDKPRLVFIDGRFSSTHSNLENLESNILFTSLNKVLTEQPELIEPYLGKALPNDQHGFTSLNTALMHEGYALILPKNSIVKEPLEVIYISNSSKQNKPKLFYLRNLIIAKTGSQVTLVERYLGEESSVYLNNSVSEVFAEENSHIDHYRILKESDEAFHVGGVFIEQATNSQVKNHNIALSALVARNDTLCNLNGAGSHIEMNGLVMGTNRQHFDNHTQVNHKVPNCSSDEYYKTILNDQSRSVFRGRIVVAEDAQKTNADQQNNNLLLSDDAEADSLPQLEIYADDVKCSHGATVGQLDPKSLFYLQSRGINSESAKALLTFAFANEVIDRIKVDAIQAELTSEIAGQLLSAADH